MDFRYLDRQFPVLLEIVSHVSVPFGLTKCLQRRSSGELQPSESDHQQNKIELLSYLQLLAHVGRVGPERPVSLSAGGFLWSALRTGLATLTASGSPQSHACGTTNEPNLFVHGVGILEPR